MNTVYKSAAEAMAAAYELAKLSGKRVWRHPVPNKWGVMQWVISFSRTPRNATGSLTA